MKSEFLLFCKLRSKGFFRYKKGVRWLRWFLMKMMLILQFCLEKNTEYYKNDNILR